MITRRQVTLAGDGLVALAVFAAVAIVVTRDPNAVPALDQSWHDAWVRFGLDHPTWLSAIRVVTHAGDTITIAVVEVALFGLCLAQRRVRVAAFVAVSGLGVWGLRILIRDLISRPRPGDPLWGADGASFPSGHTTNATVMAALAVVAFWPLLGSAGRRVMAAGAVVAALAVGLSRIAGGVHWPTDVLGGWTLALAWLCLVAAVFPWGPASPSEDMPRYRTEETTA